MPGNKRHKSSLPGLLMQFRAGLPVKQELQELVRILDGIKAEAAGLPKPTPKTIEQLDAESRIRRNEERLAHKLARQGIAKKL